jgi:enoyl-CoA hydratase
VLQDFDADPAVGAILVSGSERAFAAGADIQEMCSKTYQHVFETDFIASTWGAIKRIRKPLVAAVSGYALGGGCELVMMCDIVVASETARFGQPEIKLGIIPGAGGTQRLTRLVGQAKAMDLILTGRTIDAMEAERIGLVSRVVAADKVIDEALTIAGTISSLSLPAVMMAKEAIKYAGEAPLEAGLLFERRLFHSLFGTHDQQEGMKAFLEKRVPKFENR